MKPLEKIGQNIRRHARPAISEDQVKKFVFNLVTNGYRSLLRMAGYITEQIIQHLCQSHGIAPHRRQADRTQVNFHFGVTIASTDRRIAHQAL